MAKTYEEKLAILTYTLRKYGLSLDDPDIKNFFYREREKLNDQEFKDNKSYSYCILVKPTKKIVTPLDFENSSYGTEKRLIDWYMYSNAEDNPLVWNNIGSPKFDVLQSFILEKQISGIRENINGKLFNSDDGNHRLLTLMINQFLETKSANSKDEISRINNKYAMTVNVYKQINSQISDLLYEYHYELMHSPNNSIPKLIREIRLKTMNYKREHFCSYDENSKTFTFFANGKTFTGSESEFKEFLTKEIENVNSLMQWSSGDEYYLSYKNKVLKSKHKAKIDAVAAEFNNYDHTNTPIAPYAIIKNIDDNTYDVICDNISVNNNKQNVANYLYQHYNKYPTILFDKLSAKSKEYFEIYSKPSIEEMLRYEFPYPLTINEREYLNLSEDDYKKLIPLINEELNVCYGETLKINEQQKRP